MTHIILIQSPPGASCPRRQHSFAAEPMLETMLPTVSSFGPQLDGLIHMIYLITGVFFFVMQAALVWFIIRYRRKRQPKAVYETGETWKEMRWIGALALLVVSLDMAIDYRSARA